MNTLDGMDISNEKRMLTSKLCVLGLEMKS